MENFFALGAIKGIAVQELKEDPFQSGLPLLLLCTLKGGERKDEAEVRGSIFEFEAEAPMQTQWNKL
jgi:hypothetical protein